MKLAFVCLIAFLVTLLVARSIGVLATTLFLGAGYFIYYAFKKRS